MGLVGFSIFVGMLAFLMGVMLLIAPSALKKLNDVSARMITKVDMWAMSYRVGVGVSLLIAAGFMFFMAYYFKKRY